MNFFVDAGLKAKLLKDIQDLYTKRIKLEAHIQQLDTLSVYRIEKGARRDIDAYRAKLSRLQLELFEPSVPSKLIPLL
jgi:hypothetical protein